MVTPLIPLFWVRRLQATDPQISLIVTATSGASVVGALLMRRLIARFGRERAATTAACGYALYPLLTAFTTGVWQVIPWAILGGFFSTMITISLFDNLVSVTPAEDRTNYIAVYNILIYLSLVVGPLSAGFLARGNSGQLGLVIAAGVGFVAALMFLSRIRMARA
jgi:MFS family permease